MLSCMCVCVFVSVCDISSTNLAIVCVCVCMYVTVCVCACERSLGSVDGSRGAELNSQMSRKSSWFLCFHSRNFREVRQGSSST
uniref:Secreted protein n=1 Tax=Astyanax mexicanus TaxID=7994 RepID=A0A3B1KG70_ASTMX